MFLYSSQMMNDKGSLHETYVGTGVDSVIYKLSDVEALLEGYGLLI